MFGSTNAFRQSSTSPFGSQSGFGQTSNNPFAPKPFGSTNPFGSQSGGSFFGSTSTGVFGTPPHLLYLWGPHQSLVHPPPHLHLEALHLHLELLLLLLLAVRRQRLGWSIRLIYTFCYLKSTCIWYSGTPTFGSSNTPAFGATTSTPAFGTSSTPSFGSTPNPTSTLAFGTTTKPAFGSTLTSDFGTPSAPSFSFGSSPAFGQSSSAFGSSPFGTSTSAFGVQSSAFGAQTSTAPIGTPGFGQSAVGQRGGTRVAAYQATPEPDSGSGTQAAAKLVSISAMPGYKDKSHEELRWEDYQLGDKGGPAPAGQSTSGINFGSSAFASSSASPFGQSSANPFSSSTSSNPFAPKPSTFSTPGFGVSTTPAFNSSPFASSNASNPFGSTSSTSPSLFGSTPSFGPSTSSTLFGSSSASGFGSSISIFGSSSAQSTAPAFGPSLSFGNTQSSPLFQSTTPSFGQTSSAFGQTTSFFAQSTPTFGQSNLFSIPSIGFGGNLFSSAPLLNTSNTMGFGQTIPSLSTPFQLTQPSQSTAFGFNNLGQTQTAGATGFDGTPSLFSQPTIEHWYVATMPAIQLIQLHWIILMRQMSGYLVAPKVPFFSDEEETSSTPKADALICSRRESKSFSNSSIGPKWPSRGGLEKVSPSKHTSSLPHENEDLIEIGLDKEDLHTAKLNQKPNGLHKGQHLRKGGSSITLTGHRAGEAAIVYEHGADIEALMPNLCYSDYYTEPRIQELAAKERAEPGFCRRVKDFVVGRHGYGSITFMGETDVRRLDLESLIQFNNREVIVYMDESKKPPMGRGLNKPAEVTLLNIKCFGKNGQQYSEGPRIEKYKEMLKRKAGDQGAEFVSYDPVEGEWKFMVQHFSKYRLQEDNEDECGEYCDA
ncbi:unnamed protein product [Withania somnifera]